MIAGVRRPRVIRRALILCALALVAAPLHAQSIVDGQRVEFLPSADNDTLVNGVAVVQGYTLNIYPAGSTTVASTANLGKPTPDADGYMRVTWLPLVTTPLQMGVIYEARVLANGPGGSTASAVSGTFALTSTCGTSTITPTSVSVGSGGATGSVSVTSSCSWGSISNASWITVTSGASGTGNGTLAYSVGANTTTAARSGTLSVAGQTFTINQNGVRTAADGGGTDNTAECWK